MTLMVTLDLHDFYINVIKDYGFLENYFTALSKNSLIQYSVLYSIEIGWLTTNRFIKIMI